MKSTKNLGFDKMVDTKRVQTHDKNMNIVWLKGVRLSE